MKNSGEELIEDRGLSSETAVKRGIRIAEIAFAQWKR
jgi:hypothetical protein